MKNKRLAVLIILVLTMICLSINASAEEEIIVTYNGEKLKLDVPPVLENGRVLVPMRAIFETFGATVEWSKATNTVIASTSNDNLKLTIGERTAYKNNVTILLDVPAKIINGRTLVPVRFVSESLNARVDWQSQNREVVINRNITEENKNSEDTNIIQGLDDIPKVELSQEEKEQIKKEWEQDNYCSYSEMLEINSEFIGVYLCGVYSITKWGDPSSSSVKERYEEYLTHFTEEVKKSNEWKQFLALEAKRDPVFAPLKATSTQNHISATFYGNIFPGFGFIPAIMQVELKKQEGNWVFTKIADVKEYQNLNELKQNEPQIYNQLIKMENYRANYYSNYYSNLYK